MNLDIPRLTREQAAVIGAFTGITAGPFDGIHELAEQLLGHPIFTHQFADPVIVEKLKKAARPLYMTICFEEQPR